MKVLFAIISCHKNSARRYAQRNSWLPSLAGTDYKFFLGRGDSALIEDEVQLNVADDYNGLPEKVQGVFTWALAHGYDYICKVDDDVYIFPQRLLQGGFEKYPYSGRLNGWKSPKFPKSYLSGFTYWISAEAARMVVAAPLDPECLFEDRWVGGVLGRAGIEGKNEPFYTVMSVVARTHWASMVRQAPGALCQFEPPELLYIHQLIEAMKKNEPPPPPPGVQPEVVQLSPIGIARAGARNPRIFRLGKLQR